MPGRVRHRLCTDENVLRNGAEYMNTQINTIGVIGTGLVGAGWAAFYAGKGLAARLYDADQTARESGYQKSLEFLGFLNEHGVISTDDHDHARDALTLCDSISETVRDVQFVQESVSERYEIKKEVFRQVDRHTPADVILASSSSGLLISELQKVMAHPERSLIAHPFNPPHLIPLVELVPGKRTDETTLSRTKQFFESLGKAPVVLNKEVPGHLANRLQAAVWREAIDLVLNGVATVEDVDRALSAGPGTRWALMGQHMIFHLGGGEGGIEYFIDHIGVSFEALWNDMGNWTSLPPETKSVIANQTQAAMKGRTLQDIKRWRDDKLVKLLKVINE